LDASLAACAIMHIVLTAIIKQVRAKRLPYALKPFTVKFVTVNHVTYELLPSDKQNLAESALD
jgi:hypothetical protein